MLPFLALQPDLSAIQQLTVALTVCLAVRAVELLHITSVYHLPPFSPGEESEKSFWNMKWTVEARSFSPDSSSIKWEKKVFRRVGIV